MTATATRELKTRAKDEQSELKTREEAAAYLTMKTQTLAAWAMTGKYLPMVKIGRSVRYRKCDLDDFLRRRTVGGDGAE
ncbi:MAG: helix-turn-helix domain-containing protein [Planctomycetia bacterium]|nr:helix-turn-helix domain-containing protein [Planctomycetia bacterium]